MKTQTIETKPFPAHLYQRLEFDSSALKRKAFCGVLKPMVGPIRRTVYVLHGGNGDDQQPLQAGLMERIAQYTDTQFVLPSIGATCLRATTGNDRVSYTRYFFEEIVKLAQEGGAAVGQEAFITGFSMGGQAALNLFLRFPDQFKGVGANFASLILFDYLDSAQTAQYAVDGRVAKPYVDNIVGDFTREFPLRAQFLEHDPIALIEAVSPSQLAAKKIYFDVGDQDEFALYLGSDRLHELLKQKGITHQYERIPGGHHDPVFLNQQFPKMLSFLLNND